MPIQQHNYWSEVDGLMGKSLFLRNQGRHEEATTLQWRALALADAHLQNRLWPLCNGIAESMLKEGENRYEDALILLDHASEYLEGWQKDNPVGQTLRQCHINFLKGKIYVLKKQYSDAEPLLLSAVFPICERSGGHWVSEGQKLLADCYAAVGNLSQAEAHYEKAVSSVQCVFWDWLEAYHSLLERLGKTSTAAEVAQRIQHMKDLPPISFCGHGHLEEDNSWEPTLAVAQEAIDCVMRKYKQAPLKSDTTACGEKSDAARDYRILIARLLSMLANDAEAQEYFLATMHLEEELGGKFLLETLEQYREHLKKQGRNQALVVSQQAGRPGEIPQLDRTIEQIRMKFILKSEL